MEINRRYVRKISDYKYEIEANGIGCKNYVCEVTITHSNGEDTKLSTARIFDTDEKESHVRILVSNDMYALLEKTLVGKW